jgi:hypothetical protein
MSHPLPASPPSDPANPPLPDAAVRLVRLSRNMTRVAIAVLTVTLLVLVLVWVAASRYVEATVAALAVGFVAFALTAVRRKF